jgi:hypothetical protein
VSTSQHVLDVRQGRTVYRFYGQGKWEIKRQDDVWRPINGILVPAEALKIAAEHSCQTPPRKD